MAVGKGLGYQKYVEFPLTPAVLTYLAYDLVKGGASRERMQSGHDTSEHFHDFSIATSEIAERLCLLLKHNDSRFD
jgi:hypothetical protein